MALGSWILCSGLFTIGANDKIEKNAQYTVSSRMKIIKWLAYVAELNEFIPYTSWSVFNTRKNESNLIQVINSILLLLRQNVAAYSMQKYFAEILKTAIDILNLGQVKVNMSDQPVYALSRRFQHIYSEGYGPGKYLPMFGGLYSERALLEVHDPLIGRSGLFQFLDQSNSITEAANVLGHISSIFSAKIIIDGYVLQVCLCVTFKAMK